MNADQLTAPTDPREAMMYWHERAIKAEQTLAAMRREGVHQRAGYEAQRRLDEILDLIDGREDIDGNGGPNIFMRIAMCARGEDRP